MPNRMTLRNVPLSAKLNKLLGLGFLLLAGVAGAQETTVTQAQGQARQLGMLVGGTATQYDLCVRKGFIPKGEQSAEETAKAFFEKTRASGGPDVSAYVQEGWDTIAKEISAHESFYTQEKCVGVNKQWTKITATMRKK